MMPFETLIIGLLINLDFFMVLSRENSRGLHYIVKTSLTSICKLDFHIKGQFLACGSSFIFLPYRF